MELLDKIQNYLSPTKPQVRGSGRKSQQIIVEQLDRAKADVANWRNALDEWEDVSHPDRTEMMRLYQEMIMDDTIAGFIDGLVNRLLGSDLHITNNEEDVDRPNVLDSQWFEALVRSFILSELI